MRAETNGQIDPDRNLALELVRATEAAVMACARYMSLATKNRSTRPL
jgi:fructose-1,6-bisphosphatase/sedoheptulose 1,7-bisphosphatase-like protein